MSVSAFIVSLSDRTAIDPDRVGPKAANLAKLTHAGLPTPGGFCIAADAYRRQIQHLELTDALREYPNADQPTQRRLAVEIRLKLYQSDLAPDLLAQILTAWWEEPKPAALRSSALIEDRADTNFAGGGMADVVANTSQLSRDDRAAIANYLASLPPIKGPSPPPKKE